MAQLTKKLKNTTQGQQPEKNVTTAALGLTHQSIDQLPQFVSFKRQMSKSHILEVIQNVSDPELWNIKKRSAEPVRRDNASLSAKLW